MAGDSERPKRGSVRDKPRLAARRSESAASRLVERTSVRRLTFSLAGRAAAFLYLAPLFLPEKNGPLIDNERRYVASSVWAQGSGTSA
jgi:hypothetical protein